MSVCFGVTVLYEEVALISIIKSEMSNMFEKSMCFIETVSYEVSLIRCFHVKTVFAQKFVLLSYRKIWHRLENEQASM